MKPDPQLTILLVSTTGAGFLMVLSGIGKSMLEWRSQSRVCPSCSRRIENRTCGCTSGSSEPPSA